MYDLTEKKNPFTDGAALKAALASFIAVNEDVISFVPTKINHVNVLSDACGTAKNARRFPEKIAYLRGKTSAPTKIFLRAYGKKHLSKPKNFSAPSENFFHFLFPAWRYGYTKFFLFANYMDEMNAHALNRRCEANRTPNFLQGAAETTTPNLLMGTTETTTHHLLNGDCRSHVYGNVKQTTT